MAGPGQSPGLLALACAALVVVSAPANAATPPFVGCASDVQGERLTPPQGRAPDLPIAAALATRLAWYAASADEAVLGPAGWHCYGLAGSNGWSLFVTPAPNDIVSLASGLAGPAIQLSRSEGGTSGRFEAAALASGLFPDAAGFVQRVEAEKLMPPAFFASRLAPTDRIARRGADVVLYETPAATAGLGTESRLLASPLPIEGAVILLPRDGMSVLHLAIRLPPALADLAPAIAGDAVGRDAR